MIQLKIQKINSANPIFNQIEKKLIELDYLDDKFGEIHENKSQSFLLSSLFESSRSKEQRILELLEEVEQRDTLIDDLEKLVKLRELQLNQIKKSFTFQIGKTLIKPWTFIIKTFWSK